MPEQQAPTDLIHGVSMVKQVQTPEGNKFDMMRGHPTKTAELRAQAFDEMVRIAQGDPGAKTHIGGTFSFEYQSSSAIAHTGDPDVKANLTRVLVDENLAEGDRAHAVSMLAYANAARLPLVGYGEEFVLTQYDAALAQGDPGQAHRIAGTMLYEGDKIVRAQTEQEVIAWKERERSALEQRAKTVLAKKILPDDINGVLELKRVLDEMRFRKDEFGFGSATRSDLVRLIVEKDVETQLSMNRGWIALSNATDAGMPPEFIEGLKKRVSQQDRANNPKLSDKVARVIGKIRGK